MEAVLDKPVGEIFRDRLFSPLGMESTLEGCLLPADRIMPVSRVLPYRGGTGLVLTSLGSVPLRSADPLSHYGHTAGSMYTDIGSLPDVRTGVEIVDRAGYVLKRLYIV